MPIVCKYKSRCHMTSYNYINLYEKEMHFVFYLILSILHLLSSRMNIAKYSQSSDKIERVINKMEQVLKAGDESNFELLSQIL